MTNETQEEEKVETEGDDGESVDLSAEDSDMDPA